MSESIKARERSIMSPRAPKCFRNAAGPRFMAPLANTIRCNGSSCTTAGPATKGAQGSGPGAVPSQYVLLCNSYVMSCNICNYMYIPELITWLLHDSYMHITWWPGTGPRARTWTGRPGRRPGIRIFWQVIIHSALQTDSVIAGVD